MAEGLRIHHPTLSSITVALHHDGVLPDRVRKPKTYYINVDSDGFGMVTAITWERIQQAQSVGNIPMGSRFTLDSTILTPPPISMGMPGTGDALFVPQTIAIDAQGEHDVSDKRREALEKIAQGFAPPGTRANVSVRDQVPLQTPDGQNPDSV